MKRSLEVADIFRALGPAYRELHGSGMPLRHLRVMRAVEVCRTAEMGGHIDQCDHCGEWRISYHACRNRHCPKCQSLEKERWLEAWKKDLLPTSYFRLVFTLPEGLRPLALRNQKVIYNLLFQAASETLAQLAKDPKYLGAEIVIGRRNKVRLIHPRSKRKKLRVGRVYGKSKATLHSGIHLAYYQPMPQAGISGEVGGKYS